MAQNRRIKFVCVAMCSIVMSFRSGDLLVALLLDWIIHMSVDVNPNSFNYMILEKIWSDPCD